MSTAPERVGCESALGGHPQNEAKDLDVLLGVGSHQVDEESPHGGIPIGAEPLPESSQLSTISQLMAQEGSSLRSQNPVLAGAAEDGDDLFGHPFRPAPGDGVGEILEDPVVPLLIIENQLNQIPRSRRLCLLDEPLVPLKKFCFLTSVSVQCFYDLVGRDAGTRGAQPLEGLLKSGRHDDSFG